MITHKGGELNGYEKELLNEDGRPFAQPPPPAEYHHQGVRGGHYQREYVVLYETGREG